MMTARELFAPAPPPPVPSFEALLDAHGAEIYRHLRRLVESPDDAADLHQETFLRACRAWPALPADANHRAWLHRIAANLAVDAHRRLAVRAKLDLPSAVAGRGPAGEAPQAPEPGAGDATDPAARAEAAELREAVREALVALPWRERAAVVSRVLDGLGYAEVAALLDCSEPTARQLVSRGLRRVRAELAAYVETDR